MKISEIYETYKIPPWLQMHMYRVAAVAATLFDARVTAGDKLTGRAELISACLLHDMGNIIKFDFSRLSMVSPEELPPWKNVQREMIERYGRDEHKATLAMLNEIGVPERVREIVDEINFIHCERIEKSGDIGIQIVQYADARVVPNGVATLSERMTDMFVRYAHKHKKGDEEAERQVRALERMEQKLFSGLSLSPLDITEESIKNLREELQSFVI